MDWTAPDPRAPINDHPPLRTARKATARHDTVDAAWSDRQLAEYAELRAIRRRQLAHEDTLHIAMLHEAQAEIINPLGGEDGILAFAQRLAKLVTGTLRRMGQHLLIGPRVTRRRYLRQVLNGAFDGHQPAFEIDDQFRVGHAPAHPPARRAQPSAENREGVES